VQIWTRALGTTPFRQWTYGAAQSHGSAGTALAF
jgi:hypothetical protein